METVAVLGASPKETRYANKAIKELLSGAYGDFKVIPVSPKGGVIHGEPCLVSLSEVTIPVDTLTMYVGSAISTKMISEILELKPKRIIFNPGTENPELMVVATETGIECLEACTLIMLHTGQF
ncbi:MAG: CoA-binding protein [Lentisphaeria bacterium]|nr:CoA-binding protein [Lentisphaeria bacterium]